MENPLVLATVSDISTMSQAIAKSGLFGIKRPEEAMALMLIAQAEGMPPALAARDYHIISGRPSMKADSMMSRFQAAGGKVEWTSYTDSKVSGKFSHPAGGSVEITWTIEMAKRIGLSEKDIWKKYPRQMLRSRCISEGIRTVYPGVSAGIYTPEETEDFDAPRTPKPAEAEVVASTPPVQASAHVPAQVAEIEAPAPVTAEAPVQEPDTTPNPTPEKAEDGSETITGPVVKVKEKQFDDGRISFGIIIGEETYFSPRIEDAEMARVSAGNGRPITIEFKKNKKRYNIVSKIIPF